MCDAFSVSFDIIRYSSPDCPTVDRAWESVAGLIWCRRIEYTLRAFPIHTRDDDIFIFRERFCEFFFFGIRILEYDIERDPLHSYRFELSVERLSESESLQISVCLDRVQSLIVDLDDDDIGRWSESVRIERIQDREILTIDEKVCDRKECHRKKSNHCDDQRDRDTTDEKNMLEISFELHIMSTISDFRD